MVFHKTLFICLLAVYIRTASTDYMNCHKSPTLCQHVFYTVALKSQFQSYADCYCFIAHIQVQFQSPSQKNSASHHQSIKSKKETSETSSLQEILSGQPLTVNSQWHLPATFCKVFRSSVTKSKSFEHLLECCARAQGCKVLHGQAYVSRSFQ